MYKKHAITRAQPVSCGKPVSHETDQPSDWVRPFSYSVRGCSVMMKCPEGFLEVTNAPSSMLAPCLLSGIIPAAVTAPVRTTLLDPVTVPRCRRLARRAPVPARG